MVPGRRVARRAADRRRSTDAVSHGPVRGALAQRVAGADTRAQVPRLDRRIARRAAAGWAARPPCLRVQPGTVERRRRRRRGGGCPLRAKLNAPIVRITGAAAFAASCAVAYVIACG